MRSKAYRSVDIDLAVDEGWDIAHKVSPAELLILGFIARHGIQAPGIARGWYPMGGLQGWAEERAMALGTLKRLLSQLRKKGLIINIEPTGRYRGARGYGIPIEVFEGCLEWTRTRREMKASRFTGEPDRFVCEPAGSPVNPTDPVTRENAGHKKQEKKEKETANAAGPSPVGELMDDEPWDTSDDDGWDRPNDPAPKRRVKPTTALAERFREGADLAQERNPLLPDVWDNKSRVLANIKNTLLGTEKRSVVDVEAMIDAFFVGLEAGGKYPITDVDNLWSAFMARRSLAYQDSRGEVAVVIPDNNAEAIAEKNRLLARRDREKNK